MTEDQFRKYIDESYLNGSRDALNTVINMLTELRDRIDNETPGDIPATETHPEPTDPRRSTT